MLEKQEVLMEKIKQEVQNLFASKKVQNIFEETFKNDEFSDNLFSLQKNPSQSVSEKFVRPNFTIRKRSMDFKEKGLIVPATHLSYNAQQPNPSFPSLSQIHSPANYLPAGQTIPQNLPYNYSTPMRILPVVPPLRMFPQNQQVKFPNMASMNIVNNFTNIQNFSNQKEPKNIHVYTSQNQKENKPNIIPMQSKILVKNQENKSLASLKFCQKSLNTTIQGTCIYVLKPKKKEWN